MPILPLVLAGPIVRRVELGRVAVWMALSAPADVRLDIFEGRQKSTGPGSVAAGVARASGEVRTRKFGARLHIALIETKATIDHERSAEPLDPPLTPTTLYSYDLTVRTVGQPGGRGLRDLGLLADDPVGDGAREIEGVSADAPRHLALGYAEDFLPSFVTPAADVADVRLAQASCRKIHGPGTDAMGYLDAEIEKAIVTPRERIQQLYLTGDQIYADDVPTVGLPILHDLAMDLMTAEGADPAEGEEELPVRDGQVQRINMATAPTLCRGGITRGDAGFTTSDASSHLFTFGEYAALYLLHWSPRVWRALADDARATEFCDIADPDAAPSLLNRTKLGALLAPKGAPALHGDALRTAVIEQFGDGFRNERQKMMIFAATVGKVARILANTPTYMLFDDHDVTDDWNINGAFMTRVYRRAFGKAVVRNALLAYTLFQGIGNDWATFAPGADDPSPNAEFLDAAGAYLVTVRARPAAAAATLDRLFGFPGETGDRMDFHYAAPGLCYEVRVLDSRTRREFVSETSLKAPRLLGDSLTKQLPAAPRPGRDFLLLISSTPVLGPDLFERLALPVLIAIGDAKAIESDFAPRPEQGAGGVTPEDFAIDRTRGALHRDNETWSANEKSQHELLDRLIAHHPVVMLGGDVHFGTNLVMDRWRRGETAAAPIAAARIVQITSSAARNSFKKIVETICTSLHWLNQMIVGPTISVVSWKNGGRVEPVAPIPLHRIMRLAEKPAILPAEGWPAGSHFEGAPPDGWSEMRPAVDVRADADRGGNFTVLAQARAEAFAGPTQMPRGIERSREVAALHADTLRPGAEFAPQRQIVFGNNVGMIGFERGAAGAIVLVHRLLSSVALGYPEDRPDDAALARKPLGAGVDVSDGNDNTVVRIDLARPPIREPALNPVDA